MAEKKASKAKETPKEAPKPTNWLWEWLKAKDLLKTEHHFANGKSWRWRDGDEFCQIIKLNTGKVQYVRHNDNLTVDITGPEQLPA